MKRNALQVSWWVISRSLLKVLAHVWVVRNILDQIQNRYTKHIYSHLLSHIMKKKESSMLMEAYQNMNMMKTIGLQMRKRSDLILQWLRKTSQRLLKHVRICLTQYEDYLALGRNICANLSFGDYIYFKYGFWPKNDDENYFKCIKPS